MSTDEIAMVRSIERTIGQQIPRISVPGYDFGTTATAAVPLTESLPVDIVAPGEPSAAADRVEKQKRYRRPGSVARRR
jgi:hypothetical protein